MKKTLYTLALSVALTAASAAAGEPVTMQAPAPAPSLNPELTLEAIHYYRSENSGARVSGSIYRASTHPGLTHQYSASIGYLSNDSSNVKEFDEDTTIIPLTLAYHANVQLSDKISVYAGARTGLSYMKVDRNGAGWGVSGNESEWAYYLGVGAGIKFQVTERTHLQVGYEIGKHYAHSEDTYGDSGERTISLGVGITF